MPIICFEGASAIGKTTTANALKVIYGAFVVSEVNELFNRPEDAPAQWYFERQVERWSIAQERSNSHHLVILDGDPFQPLWYNWAYDFVEWQDLNFICQFYQPRVQNKTIEFPDLYFIFSAHEAELRRRKASDVSRQRRGFEKHLKIIDPQRRYFRAMHRFSPNRVLFLKAETIEANVEFIQESVPHLTEHSIGKSAELFDEMTQWLRETEA